jgi:hypothetical protein
VVEVYVDGIKVDSLDQSSEWWIWQKSWTSRLLPAGEHNLRLVFASGSGVRFTSIDALEVIAEPLILSNGVHDDRHAGWSYSGFWTPWSVSGPSQDSLFYTYTVGDMAQVNFTGRQIRLSYLASPMSGVLDVYVDGVKVGSIDQSDPAWVWQRSWTSNLLAAGTHTLRLVFASGPAVSFTSVDAIEVMESPTILAVGTYDDADLAVNYNGGWQTLSGTSGPYQDSLHYSYEVGSGVQVNFSGQQIRLSYLASSISGVLDVYVDGVKLGSIDQHSAGWDWQTSWTSEVFAAGEHNLRLIYASGANMVSLDALTVNP